MKRLVQILVPVVVLVVLGYAVTQFEPRKEGVETTAPLNWYKGNTHTHTLWSDGNDFPEMIVAWYQERGYDFLALSDHNILSRGEKWMKVEAIDKRKKKPGATALEKYGEKFGDEWVELRGEGAEREVRLKALAEFRSKFEKPGEFLLIEAEEIHRSLSQQPGSHQCAQPAGIDSAPEGSLRGGDGAQQPAHGRGAGGAFGSSDPGAPQSSQLPLFIHGRATRGGAGRAVFRGLQRASGDQSSR